jgi:hypothetical protein
MFFVNPRDQRIARYEIIYVISIRTIGHIPSVITMPSTPGCENKADVDDEVKTTLLTEALSAAFKIVSVYATTFGMTLLGSESNDTSLAYESYQSRSYLHDLLNNSRFIYIPCG